MIKLFKRYSLLVLSVLFLADHDRVVADIDQKLPSEDKKSELTFNSQLENDSTTAPLYLLSNINGDYLALKQSLQAMQLVDENSQWLGKDAKLVIFGNLLGPKSSLVETLELLKKLQQQAEASHGKVVILLGKSDLAVVAGDVNPQASYPWSKFSTKETPALRESYRKNYYATSDPSSQKRDFDSQYPAGYFAFVEDFSERGDYGRWLVEQDYIVKIKGQIIAYAGLSKNLQSVPIETLNSSYRAEFTNYLKAWNNLMIANQIRFNTSFEKRFSSAKALTESQERAQFLKAENGLLFSSDSTFSYSGNTFCHPLFEQDRFVASLKEFQGVRLWSSYSRYPFAPIESRFGGRLMVLNRLDSHSNDSVSGAVIDSVGQVEVLVNGQATITNAANIPNRHFNIPHGMSLDELKLYLAEATVISKNETKEGRTKPLKLLLEKDGKQVKAIFKFVNQSGKRNLQRVRHGNDKYSYEMAAYKLDQMLSIGLVPVTVERAISGRMGVVQLWINGLVSAIQLNSGEYTYAGGCDALAQENMMNVFDYLIMNYDRNQSNITFSRSDWQLWFIDHTRSFGFDIDPPAILEGANIKLTDEFKSRLSSLTRDDLDALAPWLKPRQIDALWARRGRLLDGSINLED